jgi:chaperone BCS1
MSSSSSSLARRISAAIAFDLTGQTDLLELTYTLVLRNLLAKIQKYSTRVALILRIVVPYIILLGGIYKTISQVPTFQGTITSLWDLATAPFSSKITVPAYHSLNADVLSWLATRGLARDARTLALSSARGKRIGQDDEDEDNGEEPAGDCSSPLVPMNFIPDFGKYRFRYRGHFMSMERKNDGTTDRNGMPTVCHDPTVPQNLTLECFPTLRGMAPIKAFLRSVNRLSSPPREDLTMVWRSLGDMDSCPEWREAVTRTARTLESVALEDSKKDAVVKDIAYYLAPECERFYANRGYPYRRGFLLYGPPGTGKTSFCLALAGHFNLDLYILSLSDENMTDRDLESFFDQLPTRYILLLEDVDGAGLEREMTKSEYEKRFLDIKSKDFGKFKRPSMTLSGLLNCLDGPTSRDGRIICMTSNAPDNLDPALVRPGRCDKKIHFGYANEEICVKLFVHLYTKTPDELLEGETSASAHHDISQLASDFANAIPAGGMISPAEVQGYLMIHRDDPQAAVEGAGVFAREIIEIKARQKNVAEHANEVEKDEESAVGSEGEGEECDDGEESRDVDECETFFKDKWASW